MADIRHNAVAFDDFDRANESPLTGVPPGSWIQTAPPGFPGLRLLSKAVTHQAGQVSGSVLWAVGAPFNGDVEVWGHAKGGGASGIAWALELQREGGQTGYRLRQEVSTGGGSMVIYRVTGGGSTGIASRSGGPPTGANHLLLFRRNGARLEGWYTLDVTGLTGWVEWVSVVDSTYTTNIRIGLGIRDNSGSAILQWAGKATPTTPGGGFGGGAPPAPEPPPVWVPQIIRRSRMPELPPPEALLARRRTR